MQNVKLYINVGFVTTSYFAWQMSTWHYWTIPYGNRSLCNGKRSLQCTSHVVQGDLSPKIDNNIDNMLGRTAFYQHIPSDAFNQQQQIQYAGIFTAETFAHYLHCRLLSVARSHKCHYPTSLGDAQNTFLKCTSFSSAMCLL